MITGAHSFAAIQYPTTYSENRRLVNSKIYGTKQVVKPNKDVTLTEKLKGNGGAGDGIVAMNPKPQKGFAAKAIDFVEGLIVKFMKQRYVYGSILESIVTVRGIIKSDLHGEPEAGKKLEVGGNIKGIFRLGRFGSEAVFVPREHENTGKSAVYAIDAKRTAADPIAVIEVPHRAPYGFHGFFVTEERLQELPKL
ncbi:carotenoid cleavage dioxygenase 1 [Melia azedarach]|uniref:Carotenoid cleavage dioxygenase 1 n=1 Tax=Melia azedarach TaxID=155640 RepID=A0ACC1XJX8_MELAZ|nr:carotenoid cleavage dioxygenase 1 [Melia azedarach]